MILKARDKQGNIFETTALIGPPGPSGKTPKKGVDYFTEAEKAEYIAELFASLPAAELVATLSDGSTVTYRLYGEVVSG